MRLDQINIAGRYVARLPALTGSNETKVSCTVDIWSEWHGDRKGVNEERTVTLNQGTLEGQYLTEQQLHNADFEFED